MRSRTIRFWASQTSPAELLPSRGDSCCVQIGYLQTWVLLQWSHPIFSFLPVPPQFFLGHYSSSSLKNWEPIRRGYDRLRSLSNEALFASGNAEHAGHALEHG